MGVPRIALFGNHGSEQVAALRDVLLSEGAEPVVCDIQLCGGRAQVISMGHGRMLWGGVDFSGIQAVHIRCTAPNTLPALPPVLNELSHAEWRVQYLREQPIHSTTVSFFSRLVAQGKLVINPLTNGYIDHDSKTQFYEKLRANGFSVPRTLTTNDPAMARQFLRNHTQAVVKPAIGVGSTRVIRPEDRERLEEMRVCPVLLQERLVGQTLRVHIVADTVVLTLRIIAQSMEVDSRTGSRNFEYFKLPDEVELELVRANRFLGLHFAAWDLLETSAGEYYFLDCNPGPYVMWIGARFVQTVFRQLAIYMIAFARSGSFQSAAAQVTPG
ncbi:MAG: ATP-grasp domain-containing protein [Magnetococcales bacterium]|nr:ATP-grasp domain-containing protein [Magnetococcales bacterium]MBF0150073.1 ATP-grasp domain-containing protein [Magnetococcales bacterium]